MPPLLTPHVRTPDHFTRDNRVPSPNYFAFKKDTGDSVFSSGATGHVLNKWSPPNFNIRSAAASSPHVVPLDQNPEFEAFRKQSELAKFNSDWLPNLVLENRSDSSLDQQLPTAEKGSDEAPVTPKKGSVDLDAGILKPRSPKRLLSSDSTTFPTRQRRNSPAAFTDGDWPARGRDSLPRLDSRNITSSVFDSNRDSAEHIHHVASSEPARPRDGSSVDGPTLVTPQYLVNLMDASNEDILLLDIRVSTLFSRSRITDALNLCIPTTLLKRSSFNTHKLSETFKDNEQQSRFSRWRNSKYIVVYDSNSSKMKDAIGCVNTLNKFAVEEEWNGCLYILKGGYNEFARKFPSRVSHGDTEHPSAASPNVDSSGSVIAPVIGGCPMPATKSAANPFFGNIRQNMDLIGGVGQLPIKLVVTMTKELEDELPLWLKQAIRPADRGKMVADKFLQIEKREQQRMQRALSADVAYSSLTPGMVMGTGKCIRLAGIEQGAKNRYNNIWPYEHSRVKLQEIGLNGSDYVNANFIKTERSNKRYIATQSPIPETFADFWNVVWQQDVRVIVMLTAETEGGQTKAHNYWNQTSYGQIRLNFLSEHRASLETAKFLRRKERSQLSEMRLTRTPDSLKSENDSTEDSEQPFVMVRKFTLSHRDHPFERMREVTQLQYSNWPDFGAPAHPGHLLGLIERCNMVVRTSQIGSFSDVQNRPMLVHCSAGCGRTGTFCTVDTVIDLLGQQRVAQMKCRQMDNHEKDMGGSGMDKWLQRDDEDLIERTVEEFRLQRLSMVQSLRQFVLCYESVLEWLVEHQQMPSSAQVQA